MSPMPVVATYFADDDPRVVVIQIDTLPATGIIRVNVNDGTIAQGDPEVVDLRGIHPGDTVSHRYETHLDWREVHSVGLDWLMLVGPSGPEKPMGPFPIDNYRVEYQREGRL